jgi:hypothetical protein
LPDEARRRRDPDLADERGRKSLSDDRQDVDPEKYNVRVADYFLARAEA